MITQSPKFWIFLPVVLLLSSLGMGVTTILLATHDPAFAVEEDYYEKSQHVDEQLAERAQTRALGWKLRTLSRAYERGSASTRVAFRVIGPDDAAVTGLSGKIEAFHNARAASVHEATLQAAPQEAGVYFVDLPIDRPGWWIWRYELVRGDELARGETRTKMIDIAARTEESE